MKKTILIISIIATFLNQSTAQKAKEVIEDGIRVGKNEMLFFKLQKDNISYQISSYNARNYNPKVLPDSAIFCIPKSGVNIHMRPVNPLNYSYKTEQKQITDAITEDADLALNSILKSLKDNIDKGVQGMAPGIKPPSGKKDKDIYNRIVDSLKKANEDKANARTSLVNKIAQIKNDLESSKGQKDKVNSVFEVLSKIDFANQAPTVASLNSSKSEIDSIKSYYKILDKRVATLLDEIGKYNYDDAFSVQFILKDALDKLKDLINQYRKRYTLLTTLYETCDKVRSDAESNEDGISWNIKLGNVKPEKGKIINYSISVKKAGYELDNKKEIVNKKEQDIISRTFRLRRFNRFVYEISAGVAYTFFEVPKYGTDTISGGKTVVADAGKEAIRNINFTSMINFVYFSEESDVRPFIQLGFGVNTKTPTLLFGGGLRFYIEGLTRFSISGGIAASWVKRLDKLKVGDKISGTAELEKDLKNVFNWPPKPYIGLQYNF